MKDTEELLDAVRSNDINRAKELIALGYDLNKKTKFGCSCFFEAVLMNNVDMVKLMLESGADLKSKFDKGSSALHYAVQVGYPNMVELLIKAGANVNALDDHNNPPVWYACSLWGTLPPDRSETLPVLLKYNPDLNIVNKSDKTPLFWRDKRIGLEEFLESVGI